MEEIVPVKKVLVVNLSSLHELKYHITVLNKLASLDPSYPANLPGLTVDFLSGKYNPLIDEYKSGKIKTDEFINGLVQTSDLHAPPEQVKEAWNSLIDFNDKA